MFSVTMRRLLPKGAADLRFEPFRRTSSILISLGGPTPYGSIRADVLAIRAPNAVSMTIIVAPVVAPSSPRIVGH